MNFSVYLNTLRLKGNLAYEYNPLYNYLTDVDLYIIDNKYIVPLGLAVNIKNGELLTRKKEKWIDKRGREINPNIIKTTADGTLWAKAGSLIDLDTELLNFDLNHPVDILVQPSYDGSVNLILNDNKNIPRLINSRFSVREKNTYEIVDRIGENDTNIYNSKTFDKDTSLYFQYEYNPTITYLGYVKGRLPVGLYCFYFTYCDSDDNESDYIAETGLIPVFIGNDSDPRSMDGGIKNQLTNKGIQLKLSNIDKSYNYLKIYYVRYFADYLQNRVHECRKIYKKFPINSNTLYLQINGSEEVEEIDADILNISKFNPKNILTQTLCKNMLFFGNIVKNTDDYRELSDLALRIVPQLNVVNDFDTLDNNYVSKSGDFAYYNSLNIYNKTGYFNQEFYRFGVVFIYQNGTLSNVYNTLGGTLEDPSSDNFLNITGDIYTINNALLTRNYIKVDDFGWIKTDNTYELSGSNINSRGVCQFNYTGVYTDSTIFSVKFNVPKEVSKYLRENLGIRGLFFVRQKCTPNILALCYLLGIDESLEAPVLETGTGDEKEYYSERFLNDDRDLTHNISERLYKYIHKSGVDKSISSQAFAGICPDFNLDLPYYNQIFNGGKFKLLKISKANSGLSRDNRFFNENYNTTYQISEGQKKVTICTVTENVNTVAIENKVFKLEVGEAEEAYRFEYAEIDNGTYNAGGDDNTDNINKASNLVRGIYSPYLAIYSNSGELETGCLYNIYPDSPISTRQEYLNRMNSSEPFYSISDRYNISDNNLEYVCWRGDCYINQYSHRMIRNFNDPSLPNNDLIIDFNTWDNYDVGDLTKWTNISRSDINAVKLGTWITFRVRSSMNYALRSVDHSYVSEEALMGAPRSFYPRSGLLARGENKLPDSALYNDAYRATLGFKCYFTLLDINYIKNTFSNRILYSAMAILDSFKNNYRVSLSTYFRDYSLEYGSILKLVGFDNHILVVFEHAIGIAVINERILAGGGEGEPVFINTKNVLPEELTIVTDTYGTQWPESVIKSEAGYVYGVDTVAKKIWRVSGQNVELLSDFKVNKFLVDNITLGERELYPIVGLKNVKTHYNNNKKDIMFTFYDDIYEDEEKVWNLCYNELLGEFITFYSWVPSYSENIDTKFFSFDRNTSKFLSLINKCNYSVPENTGILIDSPVCKDTYTLNNLGKLVINSIELPTLYYITPNKSQLIYCTIVNADGTTSQKIFTKEGSENELGQYIMDDVEFTIEKDHWGNYKLFDILKNNGISSLVLKDNNLNDVFLRFQDRKVILLSITPKLTNLSSITGELFAKTSFQSETIALTLESTVYNPLLTDENKRINGFTTDFYLHGKAGIFNVAEDLYPTHWYGEFHPFEFEFVVNDKIGLLKIFSNLVIISNKAEPESFHFEIEGDNYDFSSDKRNMYFRLEATKNLYLNLGSDILFDRKYTDVIANPYTYEQYYRKKSEEYTDQYSKFDKVYPIDSQGLIQQVKSSIFPLYYLRVDTYNDIYHHYIEMTGNNYDFKNLSGSEIKWDRDLNLFNVVTHIKNSPIDLVGRLRGNSRYKEGKWNILIPSIIFNLKNETWTNPFIINQTELGNLLETLGNDFGTKNYILPPLVINSQYLPNDITANEIGDLELPNIYGMAGYRTVNGLDLNNWTARKEARIRDKWIKIRIRYSGKNLAVIHSLITLYNISYS